MNKEIDEKVIANYKQDEYMMIACFVQWCMHNEIDATALYKKAYPTQPHNSLLEEVLDTIGENQINEQVSLDAVLQLLQIFGNDDLAFTVQEEAEKIRKRKLNR
ncbi:hypothetical protein ACFFIS_16445 [Virgibacillus soli]|uniref:YxiS n=1 Tax=Paracerasibacillus soli TaxID=480284 RepID=A0ABU5CVL1_9BACI|nr:hypothetical protein [Virgibacillus soli]MDY0410419.1 hypothetical protein [Virgibacillus soli]